MPVLVKLRLFPVRQVEPETVNPQVGGVPVLVTEYVAVAVQPFPSVTVTEYDPAAIPERFCEVEPLDQL